MAQKKSLYEILGVSPDANDIDIGLAYEKRLQERQRSVHHDPNEEALVQQAYEILSNAKRRAAYDASRVTAAEKEAAAQQARSPDLVIEDHDGETHARPKWLVPAIAAVVAALVAAFFATRSGPPAVKATPPAEVEAPKPAPPPPAQPLRAEQILPVAIRATGQLLSYDMSGAAVPLGIAVSLEPGTVITTCHGIAAGSKMVFRQGSETHSAELLVIDEVLDLCKLTVPGLAAAPLAIASDEAKAGDKVFALGMNAKGDFALTEGTVRKALMSQNAKLLDLSVPIAPASSGGPVLDAFGRVVGIATTPHRHGSDVNAAISSAWISQMRSRARPL